MQAPDKLRCSARIAAALLDALVATGDVARHGSVRRVYSDQSIDPRAEGAWVPTDAIDAAFRSVGCDRNLARRVGYALVSSERIGFMLFSDGVATIEKAYRRVERMFAREDREGRFRTLDVGSGRARIAYHPGSARRDAQPDGETASWNTSFCGVRQGMLEALPLSFGLLPARVNETACVAKGATHCTFEVYFEGRSVKGAVAGLGLGAALAAALCVFLLPSLPLATQLTLGGLIAGLSFVAGYAVDLARQLQAVAGARRGQLALLEQADRALAEKMDELARVGAHVDQSRGENTDRLRRLLEERDDAAASESEEAKYLDEREESSPSRRERESIQLVDLVGRAVERRRVSLLPSQEILFEADDDIPKLRCALQQVEHVAEQLLTNAAEASPDGGVVRVAVRRASTTVELTIADEGAGVPDNVLDHAFDPFGDDNPAGSDGGLGLAICYRILVEHGGELRVASDEESGTCVTVVLPIAE